MTPGSAVRHASVARHVTDCATRLSILHIDWLQNHHWFSLYNMTPNFEAVVSVLLQTCGQICRGMPYPCIFVEEVVPLLGEMTNKLVLTFLSVVGIRT